VNSEKVKEISIDDLNDPQYTEFQAAALEYGKTLEVDFSIEAILKQAKQETGLDDFGDMEFLQRLNILVSEWGNDEGLTGIGKLSLFNKLVLFSRSRLLIEDVLKKHPEIHEQEIVRPIIVLGLPRSGTTHLLNLLAADSRLQSLPLWESYEPVPLASEDMLRQEDYQKENDPRYQRCEQNWQMMQQTAPHLAAMHPMNPDHIHEELELMGPDFASYNFEWLSHSPKWRDHYYSTDQAPHYEYMKTVLKILQWQRGNEGKEKYNEKRWALKCPQHLEQIPVLQKVFPDATFVVTHRDPVSVIQSTVTMLGYGQRMNRTQVQSEALIDYWSDRIEHLLQACVRDRSLLNEEQSIDVPFHEFMADDMAMVEKIYSKANLPMTEQSRAELQRFIDEHPRGKEGRMIYHLERDFGVAPDVLRQRFNFYFEKFPIKVENK